MPAWRTQTMTENKCDAEAIFLAALEKTTQQERMAFVEGACANKSDLLGRVRKLLECHEESHGPLDAQPAGVQLPDSALSDGSGSVIGPYKLLQVLGEGGMGVVYMAEQRLPVRRVVALKIVKPGMDTREVIARFEAERQSLALMDHSHIAKVLDAGATDNGRPYFVMELVKGVAITKYCDELNLSIRERLELFVPVCHAIQHAHHKGIIHRDIKPSNVLVAMQDGKPIAKVIDFGVAKALHQKLTERTMMTRFGAVIGTFDYMSPEQAELSALDIDTRSDIYALGALMYELLTGTTPFDRQRLQTVAFDEIRRIIREEEPPKPSTRLSALGANLSGVSAKRKADPSKLFAFIQGDLDWIVMKALEKDRTRRYESANALAADVQRFLGDEVVEARPPSAWYRFRKMARRNKAAVVTVGLLAASLLLGLGGSVWQAVRATQAEGVARDNAKLAKASAELAQKKEQEAEKESGEAKALLKQLQRITYATQMNLGNYAWDAGGAGQTRELLERQRPKAG